MFAHHTQHFENVLACVHGDSAQVGKVVLANGFVQFVVENIFLRKNAQQFFSFHNRQMFHVVIAQQVKSIPAGVIYTQVRNIMGD